MASSAAPIYFKPFTHKKTNRTYLDGGIVRNNPIRVAFEETNIIWHDTVVPDVILSLGTGVMVDPATGSRAHSPPDPLINALKAMLPPGIRKKVETGVDMARNSLDCQVEWDSFIRSIRHKPRLAENSHRLNIGLSRNFKLDEVERMSELKTECHRYLDARGAPRYLQKDYSSARRHIQLVSRRLIASLFYCSTAINNMNDGGEIFVTIHCRLMPETSHSLLSSCPQFRLRETFVQTDKDVKITPIKFHGESRNFDRHTLSAEVILTTSREALQRSIEINLPMRDDSWVPISGF